MKFSNRTLLLLIILVLRISVADAGIIKVDASLPASGTHDGVDWITAYITLQDALDHAQNGDQIWVAGGTYYPTKASNIFDERTKAFWTFGGIKIYGGFDQHTNHYSFATRDPALFPTVLSGDIQQNGTASDNAYCIIKTYPGNGFSVIDGITVTGAYDANGFGGGIYLNSVSPTINNCIITNNYCAQGAGIFCDNVFGPSNATITNSTFINNTAGENGTYLASINFPILSEGGAIYNAGSSPNILYCTFTGNVADLGSAIANENKLQHSSPNISGCTFNNNGFSSYIYATQHVGGSVIRDNTSSASITYCTFDNNATTGIAAASSSETVAYCTFSGNRAGGMLIASSSTQVYNCYFYNNININNTALPGYQLGANGYGGGVTIEGKSTILPIVANCFFSGNRAICGGGLACYYGTGTILNCTLTTNTATTSGGGIYNIGRGYSTFLYSSISMAVSSSYQNCIMQGNNAPTGEDEYCEVNNVQFNGLTQPNPYYGNQANFQNCFIASAPLAFTQGQGNDLGGNIINADVSFNNSAAGDYTLSPCSRAIDAGSNALVPGSVPGTDLAGNTRIYNGTVDMGCYERQSAPAAYHVYQTPVSVCQGGGAYIWGQYRTQSGTYDLISTARNGCDSVVSIVLTVNPNPVMTVSYGDNCSSTGTVTLTPTTGTAPFTTILNGVSHSFSTSTQYTNLPGGTYPYTITDANGCTNSASATLHTYNLAQNTLYVDATATGSNSGLNWTDAFTDLQSALDLATCSGITQIWVSEGTYYPSKDPAGNVVNTPFATFQMHDHVAIYGGFSTAQGATTMARRDPALYHTTLSGDIQRDQVLSNNAYNVINNYNTGLDTTAALDGFVITGAYNSITGVGGGMINYGSSPKVSNCRFVANYAVSTGSAYGGGMYNGNNSAPVLYHCQFDSNVVNGPTLAFGGGISNDNSAPLLTACIFDGNVVTSASNPAGGGMYTHSGSPVSVTNCLFVRNNGSALCSDGNAMNVAFTTITGNTGTTSTPGGCYFLNSNPSVFNSIIYDNANGEVLNVSATPTFGYCDVKGSGAPGSWSTAFGVNYGANIDQPALLSSDYHLTPCSPAVNTGTAALGIPATDLDGDPRLSSINPDMGCYEYQGSLSPLGIVYVDGTATGSRDGSSWANAFTNLQSALDLAACGIASQIWVSEGTYTPSRSAGGTLVQTPAAVFQMHRGVAIYGGFSTAHGVTGMAQRDWVLYPTILSADIQRDGIASNNAYNVISNYDATLDTTAKLDGFTITGAFNSLDAGGGATIAGGIINVNASPLFRHCIISGNTVQGINNAYGGGAHNAYGSPVYDDCRFLNNTCSASFIAYGGGISNDHAGPTLHRCVFDGNSVSAPNRVGGAIYSTGGSLAMPIDNCLFTHNSDGAICVDSHSNITINNSTITANGGNAGNGGGIYSLACSPFITNSIIYNNDFGSIVNYNASPGFFYCDVQGSGGSAAWHTSYGVDWGANIDADPKFAAGFTLNTCSPCVNTASNSYVASATDLAGNSRIVNSVIDMGSYEYTGPPVSAYSTVVYVDANATGANTGLSWTDAYTDLQSALNIAACGSVAQVWVSRGTYTPTVDVNGSAVSTPYATFRLRNNLAIYGGFSVADGATTMTQRNWQLYPAILSGDIQHDGIASNNVYNVINSYNNSLDSTAVLDGFSITGAWNNITGIGGGIINYLSSPRYVNCTVAGNFCGGVADARGSGAYNANCSPIYENCVFTANTASGSATAYGGGVASYIAGGRYSHCTFTWNTCNSPVVVGTGLYTYNATAATFLDNCLFANNTNGAICADGSADVTINNSTITANGVSGLYFLHCSPFVTNSIVYGNSGSNVANTAASPGFFYCDVEGSGGSAAWDASYGVNWGANKDADPMFDAGYHIPTCSPCANTGSNNYVYAATDLAAGARIKDAIVDMGAYESDAAILRSTLSASTCPGVSYTFAGNSYSTAGSYTVTLPGAAANGCDSTIILTLNVLSSPSSVTYISICPSALPYMWNGLTFPAA
ncbi:MAG: right-handed parallel beta-helix repeat-containing protein, partial [Bacteroidetes bacterium]|nr:right-handed parallel beta-helix repeat-containing protein [Bacteroidota bacterium]